MVPACGKWRQEDQKFKVLLSDKMSLRLAWATQDGVWLAEFALTGLDAEMSVCKDNEGCVCHSSSSPVCDTRGSAPCTAGRVMVCLVTQGAAGDGYFCCLFIRIIIRHPIARESCYPPAC